MQLTPSAYVFLGLTAIVAAMVAIIVFALLRFSAAARETRRSRPASGMETALLSAALQEAVSKLKAQERATAARADASERLSEEIISSLTAGLLVVGLKGDLRILNPAGRRVLDVPETLELDEYRRTPFTQPLQKAKRQTSAFSSCACTMPPRARWKPCTPASAIIPANSSRNTE